MIVGCLKLFIDRHFDSALLTACFTQAKLSLLKTLGKENEATAKVIKYKSGHGVPYSDQHSWARGWKPHELAPSLGGCSWWQIRSFAPVQDVLVHWQS